ncbi:MAG: hypothetical protein LBV69_03945 [Bacteroidales bacterium]|jgi:hypothetical protein|nr:hypothetical protein [Bacteroidales bacterium]
MKKNIIFTILVFLLLASSCRQEERQEEDVDVTICDNFAKKESNFHYFGKWKIENFAFTQNGNEIEIIEGLSDITIEFLVSFDFLVYNNLDTIEYSCIQAGSAVFFNRNEIEISNFSDVLKKIDRSLLNSQCYYITKENDSIYMYIHFIKFENTNVLVLKKIEEL